MYDMAKDDMDNIQITYKGIEYLTDDAFMKKVKNEMLGIEEVEAK